MKKSKKKAFTLIEMMICITLIGLLGSVMGIKAMDLLARHRFQGSLQTWLFDFQRARLLAMNQEADIVCRVRKNSRGEFVASLESDSPSFAPSVHFLKEVKSITLDRNPQKDLCITLYSSGRADPSGLLEMQPKRSLGFSLFLDLSSPLAFTQEPRITEHGFIPPKYPQRSSSIDG